MVLIFCQPAANHISLDEPKMTYAPLYNNAENDIITKMIPMIFDVIDMYAGEV